MDITRTERSPHVDLSGKLPVQLAVDEDATSLIQIMDLGKGTVYSRDTSYVGRTNEVDAMIRSTKDQSIRWPGLWYELLQGAWDYNDWEKGPPTIAVYYEGENTPVYLYEFLNHWADQETVRKKVDKVEVINHIRKGTGLRPRHIALTEHDEQSGDMDTLGVHGRGLSIATTAAIAGKMAEKVTFLSCPSDIGSWYGEARLATDPVDPSFPPCMQLLYKNDKRIQLDRTVITVHKPGEDLLTTLAELPEWFLPANPRYRFQRLNPGEKADAAPNLLTVFADEKKATEEYDCGFDPYELFGCGQKNLHESKAVEPPRVEVLPGKLFQKSPNVIDYVFVDGLKVRVPDTAFSQIWAFWGFGKGSTEGYNPRRSNDSLTLVGGIRDLVGKCLERCPNEDIFQRILTKALNTYGVFESNVYTLTGMTEFQKAQEALVTAWRNLVSEHCTPADRIYITYNYEAKRRADRESKPTVCIHSRAFVDKLIEYVPDLERVDDVFEREAEEERRKYIEEMERQQEEYERRIKEERTARERIREDLRRRGGITKDVRPTGEVLKEAVPDNWRDALEMSRLHLLHVLGMNNGFIFGQEKVGACSFQYAKPADIKRLPTNVNQLGELVPFVRGFCAIFGDYVDLEVKVIKKNKGVAFSFKKSGPLDEDRNATISVERGKVELDGENFIRIDFLPKDRLIELHHRETLDSLASAYEDFLKTIKADIDTILGENGRVDVDKYLASEFAANYPPCLAAISLKRQLREAFEQAKRDLKRINAQREMHGLPPIGLRGSRPDILTPSSDRVEPNPFFNELLGNQANESEAHSPNMYFLSPDADVGLSLFGPSGERYLIQEGPASPTGGTASQELILRQRRLAAEVNSIFSGMFQPDFVLQQGKFTGIKPYLVSHIDPGSSEVSLQDYHPLPDLAFEKMETHPSMYVRCGITTRTGAAQALNCPPGYEPVAYWHPDGELPIRISGIPEKRVWAISLAGDIDIPPGLTIYYRRRPTPDKSMPNNLEREQLVDIDDLSEHWQNYITAVKNANISNKQKADLLIIAWRRAFNYINTQSVFQQFVRSDSGEFTAQIINYAEGNCGYCERGLTALLRAIGIPGRTKIAYLSNREGLFSRTRSLHAICEAYLDGQWVAIEPQTGYIETGYSIAKPPEELRDQFERLLAVIPPRRSVATRIIGVISKHQQTNTAEMDELPALFSEEPDLAGKVQAIDEAQKRSINSALQKIRRGLQAILEETRENAFAIDEESIDWVLDAICNTRMPPETRDLRKGALYQLIHESDDGIVALTQGTLPVITQAIYEAGLVDPAIPSTEPPLILDECIENGETTHKLWQRVTSSASYLYERTQAARQLAGRVGKASVATYTGIRLFDLIKPHLGKIVYEIQPLLPQLATALPKLAHSMPSIGQIPPIANMQEMLNKTLGMQGNDLVIMVTLLGVSTVASYVSGYTHGIKRSKQNSMRDWRSKKRQRAKPSWE